MAVVYKQEPLTALLQELPTLIMQQQQIIADRAHDEHMFDLKVQAEKDLAKDKREYDASVDMYKDARSQAKENKKAYEALVNEFQKTGGNLGHLPELFRNEKAIKVLDDIGKIPAENYSERAEWWEAKADKIEAQKDALADKMYGDIYNAKQIMAGGRGYKGGYDPLMWDIEDIGIEAYEKEYGKADPIIQDIFKSNIGTIEKSLAELETSELSRRLSWRKGSYYEKKSGKDVGQETKRRATAWLGTRTGSAYLDSGMQNYLSLEAAKQVTNLDQPTFNKYIEAQDEIKQEVGVLYGELLGQDAKTVDDVDKNFNEYSMILKHSRADTMLGKEAEFAYYQLAVEKAYKNYQTKTGDGKARLDAIASKLFGFTGISFEEFVEQFKSKTADYLLSDFDPAQVPAASGSGSDEEWDWLDDEEFEDLK